MGQELNKLNAENSQVAKVIDSKFANDAGKVNNNYKDSSLVKDTNNNPDVKTVNRNFVGRKTYMGIPISVARSDRYYVSPRKTGNNGPLPLP